MLVSVAMRTNKNGIFVTDVPAFTSPQFLVEVALVLQHVAAAHFALAPATNEAAVPDDPDGFGVQHPRDRRAGLYGLFFVLEYLLNGDEHSHPNPAVTHRGIPLSIMR
jgi:hypothetical protein